MIKYSGAGVALWTNRFIGGASLLTRDTQGNIFVAGKTNINSSGYFAIAYSATGDLLWTNSFSGYPYAMAADSNGNLFVTGSRTEPNLIYPDFLTVKYSISGAVLWSRSYKGPENAGDFARAIALDKNGNVYVTGGSRNCEAGCPYNSDYLTIAYSDTGAGLWTNWYNGPANESDYATGVVVDDNGNVIVTGQSTGIGSSYDYATVAYSAAGIALWTNRYNGLSHLADYPKAIAVDHSGNVVVTGISGDAINYSQHDCDYATVAYSPAGVPLWTNLYNGPGNSTDLTYSMAMDASGNVYVSGYSYGTYDADYATICYSITGIALWTNRYGGVANGLDQAACVSVDTNGNAFVTGRSQNNVGDSYNMDFATLAYSNSGMPLWTNRYSTPNFDDRANAVTAANNGNVFVTGYSVDASSQDFLTIAYSGAGAPLWTNRQKGRAFTIGSQGRDVAAAGDGSVLVTGYIPGWGALDFGTIKYSAAGVALWTNYYDGPVGGGYSDDFAEAIAVDSNGNVFVTGDSAGHDYATIAYSSTGSPLWTNRYTGSTGSDDRATALAMDSQGSVFVTGYSDTSGAPDYVTIKYSGAGVPLWTNRYNGPADFVDVATAIGVDASGNVFVTGRSYGLLSGVYDYATLKYSGNGVAQWTNRYHHSLADRANALAVDSNGNVFVTGYSRGADNDYATVKYSGAGVPLWTNRYNGPANGDDQAKGITVDQDGNVFVSGFSMGTGSNYDYATIKYSNVGVPLWTNRYNGAANGDDLPPTNSCVAIGPDGGVYVTGASYGGYLGSAAFDFATVKYISLPEVVSQPKTRTNNISTTATFTVLATGSAPLRYQWQRSETNLVNGGNVSGVNSNILTLVNVQPEDAGSYRIVVTNAFGSVTSSVAVLTVVALSPITLSSAVVSNSVFNFSFTNTPGANFTVLTSTNVSLPLINWTVLGGLAEISPGQFQFTDPQVTTNQQRFYCVRAP